MTDRRDGQHLSESERQFTRRWRELIDEAGGRKLVSRRLGWSSSTVSRDCTGDTLPSDERVRQLRVHLELGHVEHEELRDLLESARRARHARKRDAGLALAVARPPLGDAGGIPLASGIPLTRGSDRVEQNAPGVTDTSSGDKGSTSSRMRGRRQTIAVGAGAVAAIVIAATALFWQPWGRPGQSGGASGPAIAGPVATGSHRGIGVKTVVIPKSLLTRALAGAFGTGRAAGKPSVAGYVFRNVENTGFCLTAPDGGPDAGRNGDRVEIATCDGAASQVWIPLQWETGGSRFSQLVNFKYQSKCLNARNIGGLGNGHRTMLWNCYQSPNEYWDFADWFEKVKAAGRAYPIFVESGVLCLDADKYDFEDGDAVNIWTQYRTENQFWS
jgi:hypothetical protein